MSLIIKSKFYNKSNNVVIDYSEKNFVRQQKEIKDSGTLCRKGDKLSFKIVGALNTSNNSNENTNYMNENRLVDLISIEKKDGPNFDIDCGEWSKDIIELLDQNATYFLYKGSTIENFMKDKHRYHILSQGDIVKIGKIYLKVLHIKLNKPDQKNIKTSSNKEESDNNENEDENENENDNDNNNDKSKNNSNKVNVEDKDENNENKNESEIKNNFLVEEELNTDKNKNGKKIDIKRYFSESGFTSIGKLINTKNVNRSMIYSQKLNLTQKTIDINSINGTDNFNKINKKKFLRNRNDKKKKSKIKNKNQTTMEQSKTKNKICRICLSGETNENKNPLICPCICKGSMKYIHYLCLKNWLNLKVESELGPNINLETERPTITYSTNDIFCELCKTKLPDYVKHNGKLYNVSFYKPKYEQFIVLESVRNDNRRTRFIHIIPLSSYSMHRIGRLNNCDLSLPDSSISRVHCCFYIENNQLVLENNSKFGTKVLIQNRKINLIPDYPLCIETQNTYLKIYVEKKFSLLGCCDASTKSYVTMHPYQNQNQKGFDLFCSMVFKDDDESDSDDEEEKEEKGEKEEKEEKEDKEEMADENINLIDNNKNIDKNKDNNESRKEDKKSQEIKKETNNETKRDDINSKNQKKKDKNKDVKKNRKNNDEEVKEENKKLKKEEKNLININMNDDKKSTKKSNSRKQEEDKILIEKNIDKKSIDNKSVNKEKEELIDKESKKEEKKSNYYSSTKDEIIEKNKQNIENEEKLDKNNTKQSINYNIIKNKDIKDSITRNKEEKSEIKKDKKSIKLITNLISDNNNDTKKINNKETENPQYLIQVESEENIEKEKKNIINFFDTNDERTLKGHINNLNKNSIDIESDKSNEMNNSKLNKFINLDKINNLSYRRINDKIDNNTFSVANNYESIFGLIPNEKNESSLLLAPKHNKNIKFENYNIQFDSEKVTNRKSSNKIWDKFNWNFNG